MEVKKIMENVQCKVSGRELTIKVNLDKDFGLSKSKKTVMVASSKGFQKVEGTDVSMNINICRKP